MEALFHSLTDAPTAGVFLFAAAVAVFLFLVTCAIVMLLWNSTAPQVFRLSRITYWQAIKITLLFWILVSGEAILSLEFTG